MEKTHVLALQNEEIIRFRTQIMSFGIKKCTKHAFRHLRMKKSSVLEAEVAEIVVCGNQK